MGGGLDAPDWVWECLHITLCHVVNLSLLAIQVEWRATRNPLVANGIPFLSCKGDPPKNDNTKVTLGLALWVSTKVAERKRELAVFKRILPGFFPGEVRRRPNLAHSSRKLLGAKNWTQTFFFSNFSGTAGISRQNPGISHQKSLISLVSRDMPNFLAPTPSSGTPLPTRKISGLKSLGLGSFFVPEIIYDTCGLSNAFLGGEKKNQ